LGGPLGIWLAQAGFAYHADLRAAASDLIDRNQVFADALCPEPANPYEPGLARHRFVVLGCGGLGSNAAIALAALGAQEFVVVDGDVIESSNLNRLIWATDSDVGKSKAFALAAHLSHRYGVSAAPLNTWVSKRSSNQVLREATAGTLASTWVVATDDSESAREAVRILHGLPAVAYVHAGYIGARITVGPYAATPGDPCPFCDSTGWRFCTPKFVAPSAAPNNLIAASMVAAQLLRVARLGPAATFLRAQRWEFDLKSGAAKTSRLTTSGCEVCSP
jgi:hypothetical protein